MELLWNIEQRKLTISNNSTYVKEREIIEIVNIHMKDDAEYTHRTSWELTVDNWVVYG